MAASKLGQPIAVTVNIASGGSLSSSGLIGIRKVLGLIVATWPSSAAITFQVSLDDATYYDLYDSSGSEVSLPASVQNKSYAAPLELLAFPYVKVRSGTTGSPVTQTQANGCDIVIITE